MNRIQRFLYQWHIFKLNLVFRNSSALPHVGTFVGAAVQKLGQLSDGYSDKLTL